MHADKVPLFNLQVVFLLQQRQRLARDARQQVKLDDDLARQDPFIAWQRYKTARKDMQDEAFGSQSEGRLGSTGTSMSRHHSQQDSVGVSRLDSIDFMLMFSLILLYFAITFTMCLAGSHIADFTNVPQPKDL